METTGSGYLEFDQVSFSWPNGPNVLDQCSFSILKNGNQRLLELSCEKVEDKRITVLVSEITAVQIYEKTSSSTSKRPGFSLQN